MRLMTWQAPCISPYVLEDVRVEIGDAFYGMGLKVGPYIALVPISHQSPFRLSRMWSN